MTRGSKNSRIIYGWYIAAAGAGTNCVVPGITQFGLPLVMGYVFDTQGNYQMAYLGVAGFVAAGALSLLFVRVAGR